MPFFEEKKTKRREEVEKKPKRRTDPRKIVRGKVKCAAMSEKYRYERVSFRTKCRPSTAKFMQV
jgi:hypothetical protein